MPARRSRIILFAVVAGIASDACDAESKGDAGAPVLPGEGARPSGGTAEPPTTRDAFLAELSPLPTDALLVVYDVEGPGGLAGSLEVMLRPGGFRRENWTLHMPVVGDRVELSGTTIQTPDAIYAEGPEGRIATRLGLGALADAWLALDAATQTEVVTGMRRMHERRARTRPDALRPDEVVLGLPCRPERIAMQDVCMWEAAGLPLRASGGGFRIEALRVDLDPELGEAAFAIPSGIEVTPEVDPVDPGVELLALSRGKPSSVGAWLHPGLRMPDPRGGA